MTNQLRMLAITVILLCASLPVLATDQNYLCPTTSCDNTTTGIQIRFPFRLNTQPSYCGLPSPWFELSCRDNMTLLHVQPSPLEVYVVGIDYKGLVLKVMIPKAVRQAYSTTSISPPLLLSSTVASDMTTISPS